MPLPVYHSGKVIVGLNPGVSRESALNLVKSLSLEVSSCVAGVPEVILFVLVPEGEEKKWITEFKKSDLVQYAERILVRCWC